MRYVVKFNNGFWKVFDTVQFKDVARCRSRKEADEAAK